MKKEKIYLDNIDEKTGELLEEVKIVELQINKNTPAVIDFNFQDIKMNLESFVEKYKGFIITKENFKEMRTLRLDFEKLEKRIEDFRKTNKSKMEKPIKEFESKCKELGKILKEVYTPLKEQEQKFEEKRIEEQEKQVKILIEKVIKRFELLEKYASQLTVTSKYLNKGQKEKDTIADLEQRATLLKASQVQEIQLQKAREEKIDLLQKAIDKKNSNHDMNLRISSYMNLLEKSVSEILEEIEKIPVPVKVEEKVEVVEPVKEVIEEEIKTLAPTKKAETYTFDLTIIDCTREKADKLKEFLKNNGIEYTSKRS